MTIILHLVVFLLCVAVCYNFCIQSLLDIEVKRKKMSQEVPHLLVARKKCKSRWYSIVDLKPPLTEISTFDRGKNVSTKTVKYCNSSNNNK
ncbi:hypothetical protein L2E82_24509 [Cichorium intybus]|uniref:Uncharacterized protein n=1 Tax=Cichorium intybus TaxID=13427 RepID=A0ACB9E141_CICIN|nr:hypothetical protein L2E82_24509 [Cichorium intybus]